MECQTQSSNHEVSVVTVLCAPCHCVLEWITNDHSILQYVLHHRSDKKVVSVGRDVLFIVPFSLSTSHQTAVDAKPPDQTTTQSSDTTVS